MFPESDREVQSQPGGEAPEGLQTRLGIFGGSFDPVHLGHLHVAQAAVRAFALDRVCFVPAAEPPHKPGKRLAPGQDRLEMVRLAIAGCPGFSASELELAREGPSYTVDTLRQLPAHLGLEGAQLYLLLGSDNLPDLPRWHRGREILQLAHPVTVLREGDDPEAILQALAREVEPELLERIRSGFLLLEPRSGRATLLRQRLRRGELAGDDLDPRVAAYIEERGLYREDSPGEESGPGAPEGGPDEEPRGAGE